MNGTTTFEERGVSPAAARSSARGWHQEETVRAWPGLLFADLLPWGQPDRPGPGL